MSPFDEPTLRNVANALDAYVGENARNSYDLLYPARAIAAAVLGSERVFGVGSSRASALPYADLLTETRCFHGDWPLGPPRLLDPAAPLVAICEDRPRITNWLYSRSLRALLV